MDNERCNDSTGEMADMKEFILPVILQLLGLLVVVAEIFLPSGGLLSVIAIGLFGYSLFVVFNEISTAAGIYFVLADVVTLPFLVMFALKMLEYSPATLRGSLSSKDGYTSYEPGMEKLVGKKGRALNDLRPSGTAIIEDQRVDVVTSGEYVERDSEIIVTAVRGNQVIVRKRNI